MSNSLLTKADVPFPGYRKVNCGNRKMLSKPAEFTSTAQGGDVLSLAALKVPIHMSHGDLFLLIVGNGYR